VLADFTRFTCLIAEPGRAALSSWDGEHLTERQLPAGLHVVVNSGLRDGPGAAGSRNWRASPTSSLGCAARPGRTHGPAARSRKAWGAWLPLNER